MLTELFLNLLNRAIPASWLVLAVVLVRCLFRKMPHWIRCLLWGIVALRLLVPISVESPLSLIPQTSITTDNSAVPTLMQQADGSTGNFWSAAAVLWLTGVAVLLIYSGVSYLLLRLRVRASLSVEKDVYICDNIATPFVLGIFFPEIYLPSGMDPTQSDYVLAHERAHIRRWDHCWKPLGYLLLMLFWFDPLLWLGYILLCRDMESACDEKVVAGLDNAGKKSYSQTLLACSVHRRTLMACPVAFAEVGIKSRVKGVLGYKKPSMWVLAVSVAVCGVLAVCFLTDPIGPCIHIYQSRIVQAPTLTQPGIREDTCTLCRHSYYRQLDPIEGSVSGDMQDGSFDNRWEDRAYPVEGDGVKNQLITAAPQSDTYETSGIKVSAPVSVKTNSKNLLQDVKKPQVPSLPGIGITSGDPTPKSPIPSLPRPGVRY